MGESLSLAATDNGDVILVGMVNHVAAVMAADLLFHTASGRKAWHITTSSAMMTACPQWIPTEWSL